MKTLQVLLNAQQLKDKAKIEKDFIEFLQKSNAESSNKISAHPEVFFRENSCRRSELTTSDQLHEYLMKDSSLYSQIKFIMIVDYQSLLVNQRLGNEQSYQQYFTQLAYSANSLLNDFPQYSGGFCLICVNSCAASESAKTVTQQSLVEQLDQFENMGIRMLGIKNHIQVISTQNDFYAAKMFIDKIPAIPSSIYYTNLATLVPKYKDLSLQKSSKISRMLDTHQNGIVQSLIVTVFLMSLSSLDYQKMEGWMSATLILLCMFSLRLLATSASKLANTSFDFFSGRYFHVETYLSRSIKQHDENIQKITENIASLLGSITQSTDEMPKFISNAAEIVRSANAAVNLLTANVSTLLTSSDKQLNSLGESINVTICNANTSIAEFERLLGQVRSTIDKNERIPEALVNSLDRTLNAITEQSAKLSSDIGQAAKSGKFTPTVKANVQLAALAMSETCSIL